MGVIPIKQQKLLVFAIILFLSLSACGNQETSKTAGNFSNPVSNPVNETTSDQSSEPSELEQATSNDPVEQNNITDEQTEASVKPAEENSELLQSASIDLDADGINEQVEAVQISLPSLEPGAAAELEGKLVIRSGSADRQISFCKKPAGLTGLLSDMQFDDLDEDGAVDVFIIIPDNGASFSYYHYFIYSYKKDKYYSFSRDNTLNDFIEGFEFTYVNGGNKLSVMNNKYDFSADMKIEEFTGQEPSEETMLDYVSGTWIDPVSVDISESSKLALVKGLDNKLEIKVPLPIFGMATVNMIGEIDLFYSIDSNFEPVIKRFEVLDFNGGSVIKVGSKVVKGDS